MHTPALTVAVTKCPLLDKKEIERAGSIWGQASQSQIVFHEAERGEAGLSARWTEIQEMTC